MDFREAAELAKRNPGSVLARAATGAFVVTMPDGRVIGRAMLDASHHHACASSSRPTPTAVCSRCSELEEKADSALDEVQKQAGEIYRLQQNVQYLEARISQVPEAVWKQIRDSAKSEQKERILHLVRERSLSYERLLLVMDNAARLGFSDVEVTEISTALKQFVLGGVSPESLVVHATTDGQ